MFSHSEFSGHESLVFVSDVESGLRAIIGIHSTALGPAMGGCRLWSYETDEGAVTDVLRLSRGMSYKNALANLPAGGGKAVILGPMPWVRREAQFKALGRAIDELGGRYVTAEDVGVKVSDMKAVASQTKFVSGVEAKEGGIGGDPSPFTARGVLRGIEAAAQRVWGRSDLEGLMVAVQGLGGVGGNLCRELHLLGAKLVVADIDPKTTLEIVERYDADAVDVDKVLLSDVDVIAPCALGGCITTEVASKLQAKVVAGGANNQLLTPEVGDFLQDRGVLFAPDYLINAGGIIAVTGEYLGENDPDTIYGAIDEIKERTIEVIDRSRTSGLPTARVADELAQGKIDAARASREPTSSKANGAQVVELGS